MARIELTNNETVVLGNALAYHFDIMEEDDEDIPVLERLIELVGHARTIEVRSNREDQT